MLMGAAGQNEPKRCISLVALSMSISYMACTINSTLSLTFETLLMPFWSARCNQWKELKTCATEGKHTLIAISPAAQENSVLQWVSIANWTARICLVSGFGLKKVKRFRGRVSLLVHAWVSTTLKNGSRSPGGFGSRTIPSSAKDSSLKLLTSRCRNGSPYCECGSRPESAP